MEPHSTRPAPQFNDGIKNFPRFSRLIYADILVGETSDPVLFILLIENKHSPNQFMQKLLDAQVKLWDTILEQAA